MYSKIVSGDYRNLRELLFFKEMISHYSAGILFLYLSQCSLVSVVTMLWAGRSGVRFPAGTEDHSCS